MSWKGAPGPRVFNSEVELVQYLKTELRMGLQGETIPPEQDGENSRISMDYWVVRQALDAICHYDTLLTQQLAQLIPPGFFYGCRKAEETQRPIQGDIGRQFAQMGDNPP